MYKAVREATMSAAVHERIRIIHLSLQRTHIHMIVEAAGREALARGMQGFKIAAAREINKALGKALVRDADKPSSRRAGELAVGRRGRCPRRRGRVFTERYYFEVITTPTQAHRTLRYVLSNWRRHGEDRHGVASTWLVDPFSSGILFPHWRELADRHVMWPIREGYDPLFVYLPKTWLLTDGWRRVGPISARAVPVGTC